MCCISGFFLRGLVALLRLQGGPFVQPRFVPKGQLCIAALLVLSEGVYKPLSRPLCALGLAAIQPNSACWPGMASSRRRV